MKNCNVFGRCGGCQYLDIPYQKQLEDKKSAVSALFSRDKVNDVIGMDDPYGYRHKVIGTFGINAKGKISFGIYEEHSHRLVFEQQCLLNNPKANAILSYLCRIADDMKLTVFDVKKQQGLLRHCLIRCGYNTDQIMVILVIHEKVLPGSKDLVRRLREIHPEITTMILNVNTRDTTFVLGPQSKVLFGKGYIEDKLSGVTFSISPSSFYQVNPEQTEKLYATAIRMGDFRNTDVILDAYCGIGTISLFAAPYVRKVIGVELNREAVNDARNNAKTNNMTNVSFHAGDAGHFMADMHERLDGVILDPPRSGCSKQFVEYLLKAEPQKIVYISCNPETQKRDCAQLIKGGYRIRKIQPVDMFPHTAHCENIVLLVRNNNRTRR